MGALLKLHAENFVEDKNVRDQYINKTEVLQRVKMLSLLPDNQHMTVKAVAEYYEVEYQTIINILNRHKSEFEKDGVKTISNKDEGYFKVKEALSAGQFIVKLVPRKAILRVGMLLRDSEIAIKVRDYLLRIEETSTEDHKRGVWTDNDIVTLNEIMNDEIKKGNSKWGAIRKAAKKFNKNPQAVYQKYQYISKRHGSVEEYISKNNLIYLNEESENIHKKAPLADDTITAEEPQNIVVGTFQAKMNKVLDNMKNISSLESEINKLKLEVKDLKHQLEIKDLELSANVVALTKRDKIIGKLKKDKLALDASVKAIRKIVLNGVKASNIEEARSPEVEVIGRTYTRDKSGMIELKK
ncbi:transposase family protein [Paenibacillus polymyxa]|uniref:transposase family protein n=1 Tax=Paenibacillus polymyxa TaxID=1406 RepID=UPI0039BC40EE